MRIFILSFIVTSAFQIQAATRLQFFAGDRNAMIIITPMDQFGNADSDSSDLYQMMNVPEQDTMLGKGKAIVSAERDFNFVCGEYKNQCQLILNQSPRVLINSRGKKMGFTLKGPQAEHLTSLFKRNQDGQTYFQSTDKIFKFTGDQNSFTLTAEN